MRLAFFDLDGTLTKIDTFVPYCLISLFFRPWRIFTTKFIMKQYSSLLSGRIGRQQLKEAFVKAFLWGSTKKNILRVNRIFLGLFMPLIIRKSMLRKAREHQRCGDRVYIVSASPDIYLEPFISLWRFDGLICTNLEWRQGRLTGRILGRNCRGQEKAKRIQG